MNLCGKAPRKTEIVFLSYLVLVNDHLFYNLKIILDIWGLYYVIYVVKFFFIILPWWFDFIIRWSNFELSFFFASFLVAILFNLTLMMSL